MTVLATTGTPSQAEQEFQDKMRDRMRQAMGDLMPDAVLAGIVARGIEEAFFKPQMKPGSYYDREPKAYPSWLVEFIQKEAVSQVQVAVQKWIADNHDKVEATVKKTLEGGLAASVVRAFDSLFAEQLQEMQSKMLETIGKLRG